MSVIPSLRVGLSGTAALPAIDFVPTAVYKKENLTSKMPLLGFVPENEIDKPKMLNPTTSIDTSDRVLACRNDLRVKVGRKPKEARTIKMVLDGYGRGESSFFPRPPNNRPLLVSRSSIDASRPNKLGLPR